MKTLITFADSTALPVQENRLALEQVVIPDTAQEANLSDLSRMYGYVINGISARSYRKIDCPINVIDQNKIEIPLDFYVWPWALDAPYNLDPLIGAISPGVRVEIPVEFDAIVPQQNYYDLGYLFEGEVSFSTPCITAKGVVVPEPNVILNGNRIELDNTVFTVLRVAGNAIGYRHTLTIPLDVSVTESISGLKDSIIASWDGLEGKVKTKILNIDIPKCVNDFLALCPDGLTLATSSIQQERKTVAVYWSGCTGKQLDWRYER